MHAEKLWAPYGLRLIRRPKKRLLLRICFEDWFIYFSTNFLKINSILHYKGRNRAIAWVWSLLPEWNEGCNHTKCFRCVLFRVMYTIFHSASFENRIFKGGTMKITYVSRSYNCFFIAKYTCGSYCCSRLDYLQLKILTGFIN